MDHFDDMRQLFRTLGMSEDAVEVAALGREFRSEAAARAALTEDAAEDAADRALAEARPRRVSDLDDVRRMLADLPQVAANAAVEALRGSALPAISPASETAVPIVRQALRMSEGVARQYVEQLRAREVKRGGPAHADLFIRSFAAGLQASAAGAR